MRYPDKGFYFTAQSLQAFETCPRIFHYRYIDGIRWDRDDADEKQRLASGRDFHLAARRYFTGLGDMAKAGLQPGTDLEKWFGNLMAAFPITTEAVYQPELKVRHREDNLCLEANLDLLLLHDNKAAVWDWKTHRGSGGSTEKDMSKSLQTMVYLYVVAKAKDKIAGIDKLECISMSYWQPEPPGIICEITPDEALLAHYEEILKSKIANIEGFQWDTFDRRLYGKRCSNCEFKRLCDKNHLGTV